MALVRTGSRGVVGECEAASGRTLRQLPDGRVGALLVRRNRASGPPDFPDFRVFVEGGERSLIDVVVPLSQEAAATLAP